MPSFGTFRDPQGKLYRDNGRFFREVYPQHSDQVLSWIQSPLASQWMRERRLVPTWLHSAPGSQPLILEHEAVFFPTYPWEWTPGQWLSAGSLTLDLCEEALESGLILKDATPLNVLFSGPQPIFVDVLSFEKRDPASPLWLAQAQFVRTFLLPLAAYTHLGWPLGATAQQFDGYEPLDIRPWLGLLERWNSPMRSLVTIPLVLEKFAGKKQINPQSYKRPLSKELSEHILRRTIRRARKHLKSFTCSVRNSRWSNYTGSASHYGSEDHAAKKQFVSRALKSAGPKHVLDVGANTGVYSLIAAESGADVVAWDTDVSATELHWQSALRDKLPILPLVANFSRPTPAFGWRNAEYASLLSRAKGRFDCVLMLGVLHHLLISNQIPLPSIVEQLAEITTRWAILEWIPSHDSQYVGLCRGREDLYVHLNEDYFVRILSERFKVLCRECLPNGRTLWLAEKIP